ncbi:MAG: hypothetical protein NTX25_04980, partial [Proteobacteria bacterium]|nr:hypothetical protein [Pseudomonadota bacterium]
MSNILRMENENLAFKVSLHESGHQMLVFSLFRPREFTSDRFISLITEAKNKSSKELPIVRIRLDSNQSAERKILEEIGFTIDGFEFALEIKNLKGNLPRDKLDLPPDFNIHRMDYDRDIAQVVELEKAVHAADQSSRVNFETAGAVAGMMGYYKKACHDLGVYLLLKNGKLVGLIGFMPDQNRQGSIHISSVSIELASQGMGLFWPFLLASLRLIHHVDRIT